MKSGILNLSLLAATGVGFLLGALCFGVESTARTPKGNAQMFQGPATAPPTEEKQTLTIEIDLFSPTLESDLREIERTLQDLRTYDENACVKLSKRDNGIEVVLRDSMLVVRRDAQLTPRDYTKWDSYGTGNSGAITWVLNQARDSWYLTHQLTLSEFSDGFLRDSSGNMIPYIRMDVRLPNLESKDIEDFTYEQQMAILFETSYRIGSVRGWYNSLLVNLHPVLQPGEEAPADLKTLHYEIPACRILDDVPEHWSSVAVSHQGYLYYHLREENGVRRFWFVERPIEWHRDWELHAWPRRRK
ncbi:MAG: hypothetical protein KDB07_02190 [Planctomycetes bacterium]|nr:hypothetical protein [Planctomycetota bacterium]